MFGKSPAQQYPNLTDYLARAVTDLRRSYRYAVPTGLAIGGAGLVGTVGMMTESLPLVAVAMLPLLSSPYLFWKAYRSRTPTDRQKDDAFSVAKTMMAMVKARRLQRALDEASLIMMDEAARCWGRVNAALGNEGWENSGFATVRNQARAAANDGMEQILLLYRDSISWDQGQWHPRDFVDEVVQTFSGRPTSERMPPPAYHEARRVCERLRDLAMEAERVAREAPSAPSTTNRLDAALGEMRAIREAEEELRERL